MAGRDLKLQKLPRDSSPSRQTHPLRPDRSPAWCVP